MPTGSEAFLELPIALGYGPATGPTLNTALCHIRTLVGRRINTALRRSSFVSCGGALSTGCGWVLHGSVGCVPPLDTSPLALGGLPPQALTLFGGVGFNRPAPEAPRKRGMPTGSEAFLELPIALGYGPATGPTLNTALCHIRTFGGT